MPLTKVDLTKELKPLRWFLKGLILRDFLNLIASLPGHGKTALLTALAWQASRPNGGEFLGEKVDPGVTLFVDYDAPGDGRSVRFWLDKHAAAYPDGDIKKIIVLEPDPNTYGMGEGELIQLTGIVEETGASLVIVDSFMAAFPNADPVKLTAVQGPLWYLRRLATETGTAVVLIDHLPKPMNGEVAGGRGVMGSIAKPAQSRTVHLLTRVPAKEVQGRNVLRWDVNKLSFDAIPEPFGVEISFEGGAVKIEEAELPDTFAESKVEKAVRAMSNLLEQKRGKDVSRKDLLEVAVKEANARESTAKAALKILLERLKDEVKSTALPGAGAPVVYRLKSEEPSNTVDLITQMAEAPAATEKSLGCTPLTETNKATQTCPEVKELRRRWKLGTYKGKALELPGVKMPDLDYSLGSYFSRPHLSDTEQHDLLQIALQVGVNQPLFRGAD